MGSQENIIFADQRAYPRDYPLTGAMVITQDGMAVQVCLLNISPEGFQFQSAARFLNGEHISISFGETDAPVQAQIMWTQAGRTGGTFTEAFTPEAYARLLAIMQASAPNVQPLRSKPTA